MYTSITRAVLGVNVGALIDVLVPKIIARKARIVTTCGGCITNIKKGLG